MIPCLRTPHLPDDETVAFVDALRLAGFRGDTESGAGTRTVHATDNSLYQVPPAAVLFPKDGADLHYIVATLGEARFASFSLAARGGGTGTNGQSLTGGIVVDTSRHMNRILAIDPEARTATVEAGVVKDQLNAALKPLGLFFAPELSTSNRATIGGMISTDACGQGSCIYGKTSNHVRAIRAILLDGTEWWSRPVEGTALAELQSRTDRLGVIYRLADGIEREHRDEIERVFPKLNRFLTGYDLAHLRTADGGIDLNSILCGSEGTLALIAEAELSLLPIPRFAALLNVGYDDFDAALRDARALTGLGIASVETIDRKVLDLARGDVVWEAVGVFFPDPKADGINLVEVLADSEDELAAGIARVRASVPTKASGRRFVTVADQAADVESIWGMRKRAVGLLGNVEGARRPVAFVEDTAVPPENLAEFIAEFRALLDAEGLDYGMFGHVDAGVLHVRPALDMTVPEDQLRVRRVTDAVVNLVRRYGGVLWGEHGKGVRSEYVPAFFGSLYPQLQRLKAAFDPDDRLNPGKIARPGGGSLTRIDELPFRGTIDRRIAPAVRADFGNAAHCNGNGLCFSFDADAAMCPSFKATGDRCQSPKGRASLVREWLGLLGENGIEPDTQATQLRSASWIMTLPSRLRNTLKGGEDFSHEVKRAMDTCLACKACTGQCPVKVDVPTFRSHFLELYHGRYVRPVKDVVVSRIEALLPVAARVAPLSRLVMGSRPGRRLLQAMGLTALPILPREGVTELLRREGIGVAEPADLEALSDAERADAVVFVQDSFTAHFEPRLLLDAIHLARRLGVRPFVAPLMTNGKALHVHGFLKDFEKTAAHTADRLQRFRRAGVTLVGLDPSMTLVYRSEYAKTLGKEHDPAVLLPQEWLVSHLERLRRVARARPQERGRILLHCTEQTSLPGAAENWRQVFEAGGLTCTIEPTGCCGMAGTFGHEVRNRALSERIYGLSWKARTGPKKRSERVMATGYSCRSQVKLVDRLDLPHPISVLSGLLDETHASEPKPPQ